MHLHVQAPFGMLLQNPPLYSSTIKIYLYICSESQVGNLDPNDQTILSNEEVWISIRTALSQSDCSWPPIIHASSTLEASSPPCWAVHSQPPILHVKLYTGSLLSSILSCSLSASYSSCQALHWQPPLLHNKLFTLSLLFFMSSSTLAASSPPCWAVHSQPPFLNAKLYTHSHLSSILSCSLSASYS